MTGTSREDIKRLHMLAGEACNDPVKAADRIIKLEDQVTELREENCSLLVRLMQVEGFCQLMESNGREAADATIQPGSIVRLKSGGPDMTVNLVCSDGKNFGCHWFDEFGDLVFHTFRRSALELVK